MSQSRQIVGTNWPPSWRKSGSGRPAARRGAIVSRMPAPAARRALITILDENPRGPANELALLSEAVLAKGWKGEIERREP